MKPIIDASLNGRDPPSIHHRAMHQFANASRCNQPTAPGRITRDGFGQFVTLCGRLEDS
jgi:hypothetical protein